MGVTVDSPTKERIVDILDRYLGYEAWTLRHLLIRCHEISPAQLHEAFDIGQGTLHETVKHIICNLEGWTDLMREATATDQGSSYEKDNPP